MAALHPTELQQIDLPPEAHTYLRSDRVQGAIVDAGIALQQNAGSICALEYLRSRGVRAEVIARVLLQPARRRGPAAAAVMHKN
jgi:hypothetical protein